MIIDSWTPLHSCIQEPLLQLLDVLKTTRVKKGAKGHFDVKQGLLGSCVEVIYMETGIKDERNKSLFDNRRGFLCL